MDNSYYEIKVRNGLEAGPIIAEIKRNNIDYQLFWTTPVTLKIMCRKEFSTILALKYSCYIKELTPEEFLRIK